MSADTRTEPDESKAPTDRAGESRGPASRPRPSSDDRDARRRGPRGHGVRVDGDIEKAIRQFRKRIERDGLFKELRRRRFYEKPSERRKRKQREAAKRRRKAARRRH